MRRGLQQPAALSDAIYQCNLFDDFVNVDLTEDDLWTDDQSDTNSVIAIDADGVNGVLSVTSGDTDNDEAYLTSTNELFLMADGITQEAVCRVDFTEANTDDANVMFGFMNGVTGAADDALQDDGAGPAASKNLAVIYKLDGETVWRCGAALAAGTNPANLSTMSAGRTHSKTVAYQTLKIRCESNGTTIKVTYYVDPVGLGGFEPLQDSNGDNIEDLITLGTATEMSLIYGMKSGGANLEVGLIDYIGASQTRLASLGGR